MSAAATPIKDEKQLPAAHIRIAGLVQSYRSLDGGQYATEITMPAKDAYSMPSVVEVFSDQRIANKGQEVDLICELRGWPRTWSYVDKNTGEQKQGRRLSMALRVVD
ncbi:hypothetical protein MLD55_14155 [Alcanivorax sp. MM125-6]|nr:hypothetical protein [Alcanivorax sp. MM125-6]